MVLLGVLSVNVSMVMSGKYDLCFTDIWTRKNVELDVGKDWIGFHKLLISLMDSLVL